MISYEHSTRLTDLALAGPLLRSLDAYYPSFSDWYTNTCMPGVMTGTDVLLVAREHHRIVGVALAKRGVETKLRCIRVIPAYQQRGVGLHLIDRALKALDCDRPHCTVAEEMFHLYSRPFVNRYGFSLSAVDKGRYRRGKLEYVFNASGQESLKHISQQCV